MKIAGTGTGSPEGVVSTEAVPTESPGVAKESGKAFAEKLTGSQPAEAVGGTTGPSVSATGVPGVHDLGKALEAGKIGASEAVNQVVNRILDAQVGPGASPAVRQKVETALREALQTDPVLAAQVARLDR
jgi:hypothetical protein